MPPVDKWHFVVSWENIQLHDIHCLDKEGADKGKNQRQVFKMQSDSRDKTSGG